MEESDAAAVAQARTGDRDAFGVLVERYSRSVFRLAYRMTGNEHDAEEVVQETFLRAYGGIQRFESRAGFGTWLYRIAVNCSLDLIRLRRRHDELWDRPPGLSPDRQECLSHPIEALAASDPAPDRLFFSAEVQQRVASALARLSPLERAAFTLRHFEGMSIEEIARALGLRNGAAKNNIFRAVRKLRRALEPVVSSTR